MPIVRDGLSMPERLAVLEDRVTDLRKDVSEMNAKIDKLLALQNKGAGIFWLVSGLFGTGIIGVITWLIDTVRPHG